MSDVVAFPLRLSLRTAASLAACVCAPLTPTAHAATAVTKLTAGYPLSIDAGADGGVRVLRRDVRTHPALQVIKVSGAGVRTSRALTHGPRGTEMVVGGLLPDDGAVVALQTVRSAKVKHSQVRVFIREHGVNGRVVRLSDPAHNATLSEVITSPAGTAALVYWESFGGTRGTVLRLAVLGAGHSRFGAPVDLPAEASAFTRVELNDTGDGVVSIHAQETEDASPAAPSLALRRISRDGTVGPRIVIDPSVAKLTFATATVAPDGSIGLWWRRTVGANADSELDWATLPAASDTPSPMQRVSASDRSSYASNSLTVAYAGGHWFAASAFAADPQALSAGPGKLVVFEGAAGEPLLPVQTYGPRRGIHGAQLVAGAAGSVHLVWDQSDPADSFDDRWDQLVRVRQAPDGSWPAAPEVLRRHHGQMDLFTIRSRPTGGLAIGVTKYPADQSVGLAADLIRTDN